MFSGTIQPITLFYTEDAEFPTRKRKSFRALSSFYPVMLYIINLRRISRRTLKFGTVRSQKYVSKKRGAKPPYSCAPSGTR